MADRSQRNDSRGRRGSSSHRSSRSTSSRRGASNVSGRRRDMGSIRDERRRNGTPSEQRLRSTSAQRRNASRSRDGRMRTPTPQGGYKLGNRPINFAGKRSSYDPQIIIVAGIAIAVIILIVFFIVSCAASCGSGTVDPTANISEALSGDLRSSVEKLVTSDYQSTYVAEHADQYPTELIQLMVDEPASTDFVFNYPNATREAQPYDDQVAKGSVPLLYDWDPRWGYVEYAGSVLGVYGSGPTSVAMARMALLGTGDVTPATVASYVSQLGGATGDTYMDAAIFGSSSSGTSGDDTTSTDVVDADGDGYDDNTGDYVGETTGDDAQTVDGEGTDAAKTDSGSDSQTLASMLGIEATPITVEPGTSVTETLTSAIEKGSYVLVQTSDGAFGTTPHWALVIGSNSDGSLGVYDPTSVANSLHPWDPSSVVDGSSALIALSAPGASDDAKSDHVDEDGDGYDDETGEYIGTEDESSEE